MPTAPCTLTATLAAPSGQPLAGVIVTAALVGLDARTGAEVVLPTSVSTTSALDGSISLPLLPNEGGSQGTHYQVRFTNAAGATVAPLARIYVPAEATANLADVLLTADTPPTPASGPVRSFNGRTGIVTLQLSDVTAVGGAAAAQTVRTVAAIMLASAVGLADGAILHASGRAAVSDGGGGTFEYWAGSTATADNGVIFAPAAGTGRFVRSGYTVFGYSGRGDARWWGAKGDAVGFTGTENSTALAAALRACGSLLLPAGRYLCNNNAAARLLFTHHTRLEGEGNQASVIAFNDDAGPSRRDLFASDGLGAWNLELVNFGIESTWGLAGDWTSVRSHLLEVNNVGDVTAQGLRLAGSRHMGLVATGCRDFRVSGVEVDKTVADGIRAKNYRTAVVTFCTLRSVNDDGIALHTGDAASSTDVTECAYGNTFIDSQGVAILGGKRVVVGGNVFNRPHVRAIYIGQENGSEEGNTAIISLSITGNVVDTIISGKAFSAASGGLWAPIVVRGEVLGLLPGGGYPGRPNGLGGINEPYPYLYRNNVDDTGSNPGCQDINISGNIVTRSLIPVAAYEEYGFGLRYGRTGPVNPAITAEHLGLGVSGMACVAVFYNAMRLGIRGNELSAGYPHCVYLGDGAGILPYRSYLDCVVSDNGLTHFTANAVFFDAGGNFTLQNNRINGDPYHTAAARQAGGKWASSGGPLGLYAASGAVVEAKGNSYRNIRALSSAGEGARVIHSGGETLYCNPAALGWHADNVGIGVIPRPAEIGATLIVEDGDPGSATYGQVLNTCPPAATGQPSSGKWLAGMFVADSAHALVTHGGSTYVRHGWARLTTGSAHVAGTDWAQALCPLAP